MDARSEPISQTILDTLDEETSKRKTPEESSLESQRPYKRLYLSSFTNGESRPYEFISARAAADAAINAASMLDNASSVQTTEQKWPQHVEEGENARSDSNANTPSTSSTDNDSVHIGLDPIGLVARTTGNIGTSNDPNLEDDIPPKEADDEDK